MRISVNGLDGSGKTTLVEALVEEFTSRGHRAVGHRGLLTEHHPARRLLKKLPLVRQPDSGFITTAYLLAGYALDALLVKHDPPQPADAVIVQDGYVDRTVAFGMADGPYLAATLALRWPHVFTKFDVAVYLHAPLDVRRERLMARQKLDAVDLRGIEDPDFADRFTAMLVHGMGRRHRRLLVFDTSCHTPQEMAAQIAQAALGAAPPPQGALVRSEWGRAA
ncbi:hypothetical protein ACFP1Z_33060 [Streptomyces gamaensis]|uniref:Thymidylate kinase-like domain-containing protein n=1 Tax=Streptomyces gamaensis TaxID=1763542 RepID=A0ABW0ZDD3_9ACTN